MCESCKQDCMCKTCVLADGCNITTGCDGVNGGAIFCDQHETDERETDELVWKYGG